MIQTDAIRTVSDAWKGSIMDTFESSGADALASSSVNHPTALILIAIAFISIILFQMVVQSVGVSFVAIFSSNRREDIFGDTSFTGYEFVTTVLLVPVFSYVLHCSGLSAIGFWWTLLVISSLLLLRWAVFHIMEWALTGDCATEIRKFSDCATIMLMTLSLPLYLVSAFYGTTGEGFSRVYFIIMLIVSFLPYLFISLKKIIDSRFSLFFAFLYLCALEIMPVMVVVKVLID